jgi:hypothetical protein
MDTGTAVDSKLDFAGAGSAKRLKKRASAGQLLKFLAPLL